MLVSAPAYARLEPKPLAQERRQLELKGKSQPVEALVIKIA
jgi:hypothetical protein